MLCPLRLALGGRGGSTGHIVGLFVRVRHLTVTLAYEGPGTLALGRRPDFLKFLQPAASWTEVALLLCLLHGPCSRGAISSSPLGDPSKGYRQLPKVKDGSLLPTVCGI